MTDWDDLTQQALIGTRRASAETAHDLLAEAGSVALQQRVGRLPDVLPPTAVEPAPQPNAYPSCNRHAAQRLGGMLDGSNRLLLREFLELLHANQQRVPDALLPPLLDHGAKTGHIRSAILPVLDERGRWLAAQNPDWVYASPRLTDWQTLLDTWRDGTNSQQQALMMQLRQTQPDLGRDLLVAVWKSESSHSRYSRVKQLGIRLSMADEPFLEQALDDRSHLVRREAAALLSKLPESRFTSRMQEVAPRFLTWSKWRSWPLDVHFPTLTPAMVRDGLTDSGLKDLARLRERQLTHLIGATPLDFWTESWGVSAETILDAIPKTRWKRTLTNGFIGAAETQGRLDWAVAVLRADQFGVRTNKLFGVLDQATCAELIREISAEMPTWQPLDRNNPLFAMLRRTTFTWSAELAEFWLNEIAETLINDTETKLSAMQRSTFNRFMRYCPPELADLAVDLLWPVVGSSPKWTATIKEMLNTLTYRRDMAIDLRANRPTLGHTPSS